MKKIFTLAIAALMSAGAALQAQTLYYGDRALTNGETITIGYEEDFFGDLMWDFNLSIDLPMQANLTVKVETSKSCTAEDYISSCAGTTCKSLNSGSTLEYTTDSPMPAGLQKLATERIARQGVTLTDMTVKVTVKAGMKSLNVTYVCKAQEGALETLVSKTGNSYVSASGRTLSYNLPKGRLALFALTGAKVMDIAVAGGQGSTSIAGLRPGVYLYRAGNTSGKILVK